MRFRNYGPDPRLRTLVQGYWEMEDVHMFHHHRRHVLPERSVRLTFTTGQTWTTSGEAWIRVPSATLSGLLVRQQPSVMQGEVRALAAELFPWGARQLLAWSAATPQEQLNELVAQTRVSRKIVTLLDHAEWEEARHTLDAWLLSLWHDRAAQPGKGVLAAEQIYQTGGNLKIHALAGELNVSPRQLERQFTQQVGIGAKPLARLIRFEEAHHRLRQNPQTSVATLAVDLGYFDHSHLINEFQSFTHLTPGTFVQLTTQQQTAGWNGWVPR